MILARPVPGNRIVPFGKERLPSDVLSDGRPAFRVTQRFGDVNPAFPNLGAHRATDLGNYFCGAPVFAVHGGKAQTIGPDQYGALGIIIDHGAFTSVYWHLNAFSIQRGTAVPVGRGQQIGIVGKTGLGAVCHLHFEIKVNGTRIDPEPYLFGLPFTTQEQDDVKLPVALASLTYAEVGIGNRLRVHPTTTDGSLVTDKLERVQVFGSVTSEKWTIAGKSGTTWFYVGLGLETWYVATVLLPNVRLTSLGEATLPLPQADCSAQEQALAQARTKLARAATSAAGAAQAATATVAALR